MKNKIAVKLSQKDLLLTLNEITCLALIFTSTWDKYMFMKEVEVKKWVKVKKQVQVHETSLSTWYKYNYRIGA